MATKPLTQKILKAIKSIDLFGSSIKINYKKEHKLRTQFGGALTVLSVFFAIGLAWMLGKEIIYKDNPYLIFTKVQKNISEVFMKDVPVLMDFLDRNGNPLPNPESLIDFFAEQVFFIGNGNTFTTHTFSNFTLERCKPAKHFGKHSSLLSTMYIKENAVCINVDNYTSFYNDYASIPSSYFGVGLRVCNNKTRQEGNKCADTKYLNDVWKKFYVRCSMPDYFIDPLRYDKPAELYLYTKIQDVSMEYNFRNYMQIKTSEIITDVGWFTDEIISKTITQFSGIIPDVGTSLPSDPDLKYYFSFESPILGDQYKRSYLKLPAVIASLGGMLNIVFVVGKVLCYKINEVSMYLQESKDLVNFNEEDINDISDYNPLNDNSPSRASKLNLLSSTKVLNNSKFHERLTKSEAENNNSKTHTLCENVKVKGNEMNMDRVNKHSKERIKEHVEENNHDRVEIIPTATGTVIATTAAGGLKLHSDTDDNILKLNTRFNGLEHLKKVKVESPVRRTVPKKIAEKAQEKKNFNMNIKWKVDEVIKDASGNYLRQKLNFCTYLSVNLCTSRKELNLKSRKIMFDSIINFFKTKVDIRNIIKQSNDVEILKYLVLGNYPNYDQLFNLKFPLDQIVKDFEFNRINKAKGILVDEEEKKNIKDDKEENEYQKEVRKILEVMKDNFNQRSLFD